MQHPQLPQGEWREKRLQQVLNHFYLCHFHFCLFTFTFSFAGRSSFSFGIPASAQPRSIRGSETLFMRMRRKSITMTRRQSRMLTRPMIMEENNETLNHRTGDKHQVERAGWQQSPTELNNKLSSS